MTMVLPMTVVAMSEILLATLATRLAVQAAGELDVHLDAALELGAVGEDDARGTQVAADAGALVEGDGGGGGDVTIDLAVDVDGVDLDVGLDDGAGGDDEMAAEADAALDATLDDQVFVAGDVAADGDPRADVADALGGPKTG